MVAEQSLMLLTSSGSIQEVAKLQVLWLCSSGMNLGMVRRASGCFFELSLIRLITLHHLIILDLRTQA